MSWHWSFRCSRGHFCGITCSTWIVAAAMAPPTSDVAQRRPRLEPPPTRAGPRHEPDLRSFWWSCRESNPFRGAGQGVKTAVSCEIITCVIH
jgi:hypothetical protein